MKYLKLYNLFLEKIEEHKVNEIVFPELDIKEQIEYLYDILGKENVSIECKYLQIDHNKEIIKSSFVPTNVNFIFNYESDYYKTYMIKSKTAINIEEKVLSELADFYKHLKESLPNFSLSMNTPKGPNKSLMHFICTIKDKNKIPMNIWSQEFEKDLRNQFSGYEIRGLSGKHSIGKFQIMIEYNGVNSEPINISDDITDGLFKLKEKWNFSDDENDDHIEVWLTYPSANKFKPNFI